MQIKHIFSFLGLAATLAFTACEPIEDRDMLKNSFDADGVELQVVQATDGGNKLSIQMNTPGVTGYWDYIIDKKYTDRVEVVFPFTGKHEFTYHITTPYIVDGDVSNKQYIEKKVSVEITKLDERLPDAYYYLVGENLEGKTWVFNTAAADNLWWFMSDPGNPWGLWWNAGVDAAPADKDGMMKFDLAGGTNYTYYPDATAEGVTGSSFVFNADYTKITIAGDSNILGSMEGGGNGKVFQIVELTNDRMVLFVPNAAWSTGWTWVFVPQSN